jgi:hypothetical protein
VEFLLSPIHDAEVAKRFFLKALRSTSDSAPQTHMMKEQMAQPTVTVNPTTPNAKPVGRFPQQLS